MRTDLSIAERTELIPRIHVRGLGANLLQQCAAAALCALLMFGPLAFGAVEHWSQLVIRVGGAALGLGWFALQLFTTAPKLRFSPSIHIPLAALAILVGSQVLFGRTAYYEQTVQASANWVMYALALLASSTLLSDSTTSRRVHIALGAFGFFYAVYALGLYFSAPGQLFWSRHPEMGGTAFGAYVNRNHYAGLMELLTPFPLIAALRRDLELPKRLLFGFCGLFMAATVFVSGSRGGMLAVCIQFCVLALLWKPLGSRKWIWTAGALALLILVAWFGGTQVADRLGSLASVQPHMRQMILHDSIPMFSEKPLLGWGLGVFPTVYPQFRSFYTNEFVNQAHNDFLQILVELGLAGLLAFLGLLWGVFRRAVAEVDIWQEDAFSNLSIASMLGVVGLLAHSFTDFNLQIPANALIFFAFCGIASRDRQDPE